MLDPAQPALYTPFYCEENVYQLLASLDRSRYSRSFAVFVSNLEYRSLLFQQKASIQGAEQGHYVLWDYHVVAVAVERERSGRGEKVVVLDRDSRLGPSVPLTEYVAATFRPDLFEAGVLEPSLRSRFRVVPAADFLAHFASDRSHMLVPLTEVLETSPLRLATSPIAAPPPPPPRQYLKPVPPYPPICGAVAEARGETHNLWTRFLDMRLLSERSRAELAAEKGRYGTVLTGINELIAYPWGR